MEQSPLKQKEEDQPTSGEDINDIFKNIQEIVTEIGQGKDSEEEAEEERELQVEFEFEEEESAEQKQQDKLAFDNILDQIESN